MTQQNPPNNQNPTIHETTWFDHANCKNQTHQMFPKEHKDITYITGARNICEHCTVQTECLEYALTFPAADMHGVWANHTSRQLANEQKQRQTKPTQPTLSQLWGN